MIHRLPEHEDEVENPRFKSLVRYCRHFSRAGYDDDTLNILRGHLLIEEIMHELVLAKIPAEKYLEKARLTFYQRLCLVQAIYTDILPKEWKDIWGAIDSLNKLRNKLSHSIDGHHFEQLTNDFVEQAKSALGAAYYPTTEGDSEVANVIFFLFCSINYLIDPEYDIPVPPYDGI